MFVYLLDLGTLGTLEATHVSTIVQKNWLILNLGMCLFGDFLRIGIPWDSSPLKVFTVLFCHNPPHLEELGSFEEERFRNVTMSPAPLAVLGFLVLPIFKQE